MKVFFWKDSSKGTQFTVITFAIEQIELHSVGLQQKILGWILWQWFPCWPKIALWKSDIHWDLQD